MKRIINGILDFMRQPRQAKKGTVYLNELLPILGAICSAVMLIPTIITLFLDEPIWVPILGFALSSLGGSLIVGFINCRIFYDEERFVAKNFWGIRRTFTYDQVTAIKNNLHESYIYMGKCRVMIDEFAVGGDTFIKLVKKKYRTMHDGHNLPEIHKTEYDLFKGNVTDAGSVLFGYILILVLSVSVALLVVIYTYLPRTTGNTIEQSVCFVSCDANKKDIVLTSTDKQRYVIQFVDEQFDSGDIQAICDGKTMVTAYSIEVTPDDEAEYYAVKAIVQDGSYLLSFEETNKFHRQNYWPIMIFGLGLCLFLDAYVVGSVVVGRNPQKFSKRFVRFFFRDGYIKR